jgi:hypothetical protein
MDTKDLFLCHNKADKDWAKRLGAKVELEQWNSRRLSVFLDEWDIDLGENFVVKINQALEQARFIALLLSPEMMASDWCNAEFAGVLAQDPTNRSGRIIPLRVRDSHRTTGDRLRVPPLLVALNHLDFRQEQDFARNFSRLLARLRGEAPPRGGAHAPRPTVPRTVSEPQERQSQSSSTRPADPDEAPEMLLSNLLPVRQLPTIIWSASTVFTKKRDLPTGLKLPPFILRECRLFCLTNLSTRENPFSSLVKAGTCEQHQVSLWCNDSDRCRWVIALLNQAVKDHLWPEVGFDPEKGRFFFRPQGSRSVKLTWGSGTQRTVVRAPDQPGSNWVHQAARLRFETLGSLLYLSVEPTYAFTTDGTTPVLRESLGPLAMKWGGKERNGTILRHVLMWSDVLAKGRTEAAIAAGDQQLVIGRLPAAVQVPVGIANDRVEVGALLQFQRSEFDLDPPPVTFGYQTEIANEPGEEVDEDA